MTPFRLCVFCGSSPGADPRYTAAARELGAALARRGIPVVYGAGGRGVMGALADGAVGAGGEIIGVIPRALVDRELGRRDLTELHVVETMHERKALMQELSGGFAALPGGLGTLEELFEIATWAQLGLHHKPVAVANVAGYYDPLAALLAHAEAEGFVRGADRGLVRVVDGLPALLEVVDGWAGRSAAA